jgi:hypothetical protein
MRNKTSVWAFSAGLVLLIFGACANPVITEVDRRVTYGVRVYPPPEHGTLRLSDEQVPGGTYITIYANPESGFELKEIILHPAVGNDSTVITPGPKYSTQINSHNSISATFTEIVDSAKFSISVDNTVSNGLIYPERLTAAAGQTIRIDVIPDDGYDLVEGSLKVDGGVYPVSPNLPYTFTLPLGNPTNVTIEGRFERLAAEDIKARAWKYLSAGQYDTAAVMYESAYQRNKGDSELILYSTIALLGNILIDPDVRSLLGSGSLYFSPVPSTLEDWVCDDLYWTGNDSDRWYVEYAATEWTPEDATLPKFYTRFSGFVKPFGDSPLSQQPGPGHLMAGDSRPTREKFNTLIFWALISSYRSGFNPFIEKVNRYVFGEQFNKAVARAATLPNSARIPLNPRLQAQFKLDDLYGSGDVYIGKPELDYVIGTLLAAKGAFEYLSVYDWTIDLRNWLMDYVQWEDGLEKILEQMFSLQENNVTHKNLWKDPATVAKMLPLKNNFLQVRDIRAMDRAKADITVAAEMMGRSMDYWFDRLDSSDWGDTSKFIPEAQASRRWAQEGLAAVKAAIDSGGIFYFPWRLPNPISGARWPDGSDEYYNSDHTNRIYGVKMSKFFTPGVFTLTNLFTTELGGRAPSLFKVTWYEDRSNEYIPVFSGEYTLVTEPIAGVGGETNVEGTGFDAPYGIYSFEVNTKNLKEIFPYGFGDLGDAIGGRELMYKVFPKIPLWPWAETYFTGLYKPARKLYEFYHKITID